MDNVVMVKVVHDVRPLEFTIIVVRVHLLGDGLVEVVIEVAQKRTALLRAKVEHED